MSSPDKGPAALCKRCHFDRTLIIKQRARPLLGCKRFESAVVTLAGIELVHHIKKGQFDLSAICPPEARTPYTWEAVSVA